MRAERSEIEIGGTMSIRNAFVAVALAVFAAGVAAEAGAQQRREGPCAADAKKFCGDVQPGQGGIAKCMKAHDAELSPACRERMKARAEKAEKVREECKPDVEKFCKGIAPGGGRMVLPESPVGGARPGVRGRYQAR